MIAWFEQTFFWVQVISAFVSLVLTVAIIYLIVHLDYFGDHRDYKWRVWRMAKSEKKHTLKQWQLILEKITHHNPEAWTEAFKSADAILNEVLKSAGYHGRTIDERLIGVAEENVSGATELKRVRKEVFGIIDNPMQVLEHAKAKEALRAYRHVFRQFGIIE